MTQVGNDKKGERRPLASRQQVWAHRLSTLLANTGITPNQISFTSIIIAVIGLVLLTLSVGCNGVQCVGLYLAAAFACQLRLLCNLMDGMVALEAGKHTPDGMLWNEFPDRLADIALLLGIGIAADQITLAWAVVALSILVAYVRELGKGLDGTADFCGPMAKPHRMALLSAALVLSAIVAMVRGDNDEWLQPASVLTASLWVCGIGCVITIWRRVAHMQKRLNA